MTINIQNNEKVVKVYDKNSKELLPCTLKRAAKLVNRKCAKWIGFNKVQLLINDDDRLKLRKEIIAEAKRICYICGERIPFGIPPTLDHVKPKKQFGFDEKRNLKCCCKRCNDDKANRTLSQYIAYMKLNRGDYDYIGNKRLYYLESLVVELSAKEGA